MAPAVNESPIPVQQTQSTFYQLRNETLSRGQCASHVRTTILFRIPHACIKHRKGNIKHFLAEKVIPSVGQRNRA
jgi:hypothetical protein